MRGDNDRLRRLVGHIILCTHKIGIYEREKIMKIKLFQAVSASEVEKRVNDFISDRGIKVLELQYSSSVFYSAVMLVYEEVGNAL
jgi:hypothetical protein